MNEKPTNEMAEKLNEELSEEKVENAAGGFGMYTKTCPVCGKKFATYGETYCSKACEQTGKFTVGILKDKPF